MYSFDLLQVVLVRSPSLPFSLGADHTQPWLSWLAVVAAAAAGGKVNGACQDSTSHERRAVIHR